VGVQADGLVAAGGKTKIVPLPLAAVGTSVKAVPLLLVAAGKRAKAVAPAASRSRFFPMLVQKKVCMSSVKTDCEDQATPRGRPKNLSYAPGFGTTFSGSRSHLQTLVKKRLAFAFCKLDRFFQRNVPALEHLSCLL
jgi:hypothetical protein